MEAAEALSKMLENPAIAPVIADLWAKSLDVPGAEELEKRLRKMGIKQGFIEPSDEEKQADSEGGEPNPEVQRVMEQADMQMQEMNGQLQQMQQALQEAQAKADDKTVLEMKAQIDEQKVQIDAFKARTDRIKVLADIQQASIEAQTELQQLLLEPDPLPGQQ